MSANLLDTAESLLTPDVVNRAATSTGEPPEKTRSAMQNMIPTAFAAITAHASKPGGEGRVFGAVTETSVDEPEPAKRGQGLVDTFLGERSGYVTDAVASASGIRRSSAGGLLAVVFAMVGGLLAKEVAARGLGASGLSELLRGQRKAIIDRMPEGASSRIEAATLPEGPGTRPHARFGSRSVDTMPLRDGAPKRRRWIGVLLAGGAAALLVGLFSMFIGRNHDTTNMGTREAPTGQAPVGPAAQAPQAPAQAAPSPSATEQLQVTSGQFKLPDGKILSVDPNGPAAQFAQSVGDPSVNLPRTFSIDLDFAPGQAILNDDSNQALDPVVDVLKAYPSARVQVEGETDATGSPDSNQKLGAARADAVKQHLVDQGIAADRIETVSARDQHPVAPNDTTQGRSQNRRVDVVLLSR